MPLLTAPSTEQLLARPLNPTLTKYWKICLPATLAGQVELYLNDPIHKKPKYGSRAELLTQLLTDWVELQKNAASADVAAQTPTQPSSVDNLV